jgi:chemotaxis protein methyltransferase CheR
MILGAAETVVGLTERFKPFADKRGLFAPNSWQVIAPRCVWCSTPRFGEIAAGGTSSSARS